MKIRILKVAACGLVLLASFGAMAASQLQANFSDSVSAVISGAANTLGLQQRSTVSLQPLFAGTVANGTGADQGNQCYVAQVTLAAGATNRLSLNSMTNNLVPTVTDAIGNSFNLTSLKYLGILCLGNLGCTNVTAVSVNSGGTSYAVNDIVIAAGGTGTKAAAKVTAVSSGVITSASVVTNGSYTVGPAVTNSVTGGSGSGASLVLTEGQIASGSQVYVEGDALTIGGVGNTGGWTSWLSSNSATLTMYSGTANNPGAFKIQDFGSAGWVVGGGISNTLLLITNSGANPVTYLIVVMGD